MRVLLGLAALAATVSGQAVVTLQGTNPGSAYTPSTVGNSATAAITMWWKDATTAVQTTSTGGSTNTGIQQTSNNYLSVVPFSQDYIILSFQTNAYTAQMQYSSTNPPANPVFTCDPCTNGNVCNTASGPGVSPCANLNRLLNFGTLTPSVGTYSLADVQAGKGTPKLNQLLVKLWDSLANVTSYTINVFRLAAAVVGDPQIAGMQGQDFQVHGVPDEIFNMITYPNLQVNARFVYLSSGACHDNFTACFAHPGTYISEEGIRVGKDKIRVVAGSYKHGLSVSVNGVKVTEKKTPLKLGSVELQSHRRVVIKTPIMSIGISNSDKFLNQDTALFDEKLLALGAERTVLGAGETFHSEVPLHGLQGQTWRNVEYPSGLEYEGSISDYQVVSGNLFGSDFVFNQYKQ